MKPVEYLTQFFDGCDGHLVLNLFAKTDDGKTNVGEFFPLSVLHDSPATIDDWITAHADKNIYFVPALCEPGTKKQSGRAALADLAPVDFVFIDCDPPKTGDVPPDWKEKQLDGIDCYAINDTGNGLHFHYRLDAPVSQSKAKKLQKLLVSRLNGDVGATGLNQPARLPGTKTKAGGVTKNLKFDRQHRFVVSVRGGDDFLDRLTLSAATRHTMLTGEIDGVVVDDPSKIRFRVISELILADENEDVLHELLERSDLAMSPNDERKFRNERNRQKEIDRIREKVGGWLTDMNEEHFVTVQAGTTVLGSYERDALTGHRRIQFAPVNGLRKFYENKRVEIGQTTVNMFDAWMRHRHRREFDRVICDPSQPPGARGRVFNNWQGMIESRAGDVSVFQEFLRDIICDGDEELYDYAVKFFARLAQCPGERGEVAFVMRGKKGTGKGTLAGVLGAMFKGHYRHIFDPQHLTGRFNDHLRDVVLLFGDEVFYAGDRKHEGVLKGLITEKLINIEKKNMPVIDVPNMLTMILAANADWAIPASSEERRYCVANVSAARIQDHEYFEAVRRVPPSAVLHWLLSVDITDFNHWAVPDTKGLREQKDQSMNAFDKWLVDYLDQGQQPFPEYFEDFNLVPLTLLFDSYEDRLRRSRFIGECPQSYKQFTVKLRETMPEPFPKREGRRVPYEVRGEMKSAQPYRVPSLEEWREYVTTEYLKRPIDWAEHVEEEINPRRNLPGLKAIAFDHQRRLPGLEGKERDFCQTKLGETLARISEIEQGSKDDDAPY